MQGNIINRNRLESILDLIVKTGLYTYKKKFSKASLPELNKAEKEEKKHIKGAIFAVRSKVDFTPEGVKGYVITSKETLYEDVEGLSHWTPNIYRCFSYTNSSKRYVKGHEENNIAQVNTFVVDIDTTKNTVQDILMACIDNSIGRPTLIVKTTRGYQVYFVLDKPIFFSNKNNFKISKIAKRISKNIKSSLNKVDADLYCNDFGFFRIPNSRNIVWIDEAATYNFDTLLNWSMRYDDDRGSNLFTVFSGTRLPEGVKAATSLSDWFNALIHTTNIKGGKGQIGRNNAMFTISLICLNEGKTEEETLNLLDEFNARLDYPLTISEVKSTVKSAFSGKYNGAQKDYVLQLLEQYVPNSSSFNVKLSNFRGWYKHKKARSERVRSHLFEWETDLINYITAQKSKSELFIWHSQKELCEILGIAQSTLNKLLKESTKIIKTVRGSGRNAKTGWTTVALFIKYGQNLAMELQDKKGQYRMQLKEIIESIINDLIPVAGYERLIAYLSKLEWIDCDADVVDIRSGIG